MKISLCSSFIRNTSSFFKQQRRHLHMETSNRCIYVDTHCNIPNILQKSQLQVSPESFEKLRSQFIFTTNKKSNLIFDFDKCISVSSDSPSQEGTYQLMQTVDCIYGAFGIHPLYAEQYTESCEKRILELMKHPKTVAYGEIGLDYHIFEKENYAKPPEQKRIFEIQMKHAISLKKPIIIHTREAEEDTFNMMKEHIPKDWKIHAHCFTDTVEFAKKLIDYFPNLFIGFTGVITFKNADSILKVVKEVPMSRLLLETGKKKNNSLLFTIQDGPFMTPIPHRGKVCHPGHIPFIAEKIAEVKEIELSELYRICRENTKVMYGV